MRARELCNTTHGLAKLGALTRRFVELVVARVTPSEINNTVCTCSAPATHIDMCTRIGVRWNAFICSKFVGCACVCVSVSVCADYRSCVRCYGRWHTQARDPPMCDGWRAWLSRYTHTHTHAHTRQLHGRTACLACACMTLHVMCMTLALPCMQVLKRRESLACKELATSLWALAKLSFHPGM